jgi:uncharacterized protein DUF3563
MIDRDPPDLVSLASESRSILQRLRRLWRVPSAEERYLAAATDTADLERRARVLDRGSDGPVFATFNH